jgi:hypothetical protein
LTWMMSVSPGAHVGFERVVADIFSEELVVPLLRGEAYCSEGDIFVLWELVRRLRGRRHLLCGSLRLHARFLADELAVRSARTLNRLGLRFHGLDNWLRHHFGQRLTTKDLV